MDESIVGREASGVDTSRATSDEGGSSSTTKVFTRIDELTLDDLGSGASIFCLLGGSSYRLS